MQPRSVGVGEMARILLFCQVKRRSLIGALVLICASSAFILTYHQSLDETPWSAGHELGDDRAQPAVQACVHPTLEFWPPERTPRFVEPSQLGCHLVEENWIYVENGTFRILPSAQKKHGYIWCELKPMLWRNDYEVEFGEPIRHMPDGTPIPTDFFETRCESANGSVYYNLHSGIHMPKAIHEADLDKEATKGSSKLNILMFGFDSLSRLEYQRNLPETYEYLVKVLGGVVLEGYNIVGRATLNALLPMTTGKFATELPEGRRGFPGATQVDDYPWLWKDFKNIGYVTQWGEDMPSYSTFSYMMLGFKKPPVNHYIRPFYIRAESSHYSRNKPYCLGSKPRHLNLINWARDFFLMYQRKPKFSFLFHNEITHNTQNSIVRVVDSDLKEFLQFMNENGYLDNTMLVLMSDHGLRLRPPGQWKYEERMPFFSVRMPPWWVQQYPNEMKHLQINSHRLTTPFDIHATFHHIIELSGSPIVNTSQRAMSLFKEIPLGRTCHDAAIEPHWCACLKWRTAPVNDVHGIAAARAVVDLINSVTEPHRNLCVSLVLNSVQQAEKYRTNSQLPKFNQGYPTHGHVPDFSDDMKLTEELYQVMVSTLPGGARYEATLKHTIADNSFVGNIDEISRVSKYGNEPRCVMDQHPQLKPFCYCKDQL